MANGQSAIGVHQIWAPKPSDVRLRTHLSEIPKANCYPDICRYICVYVYIYIYVIWMWCDIPVTIVIYRKYRRMARLKVALCMSCSYFMVSPREPHPWLASFSACPSCWQGWGQPLWNAWAWLHGNTVSICQPSTDCMDAITCYDVTSWVNHKLVPSKYCNVYSHRSCG